jgi:hypothetical protein
MRIDLRILSASPERRCFSITHFCNPGSNQTSNEILPPLQLGLQAYKTKICLGVHVPSQFFNFFDLSFYPFRGTFDEVVSRPSAHRRVSLTSMLSNSRFWNINTRSSRTAATYGRISGAPRSLIQALVRACKSASGVFALGPLVASSKGSVRNSSMSILPTV